MCLLLIRADLFMRFFCHAFNILTETKTLRIETFLKFHSGSVARVLPSNFGDVSFYM